MIPIYLDPARTRIALVGRGALAARRARWLREGGAAPEVWSDAASEELAEAAGARLINRLPQRSDLERYHVAWVADLPLDEAELVAAAAREAGVLVNVEDVVRLCDFHTPAVLRRGGLTLAAATGGASPAVARIARERLEQAFPAAWGEALDDIARAREALRRNGADAEALAADARRRATERGLV
jgi:precorrin-2 dehydrogenase/sirohydrochlorin ferrochelatase